MYQGDNSRWYDLQVINLRGGAKPEENNSTASSLWTSISSIFQMNLNAKDELGSDDNSRIIHLDKRQLLSSLGGGDSLMTLRNHTVNLVTENENDILGSLVSEREVISTLKDGEIHIHFKANEAEDNSYTGQFEGIHEISPTETQSYPEESSTTHSQETFENLESYASLQQISSPLHVEESQHHMNLKDSIDEIVKEEWSMVPDTEAEDEGVWFESENIVNRSKSPNRHYKDRKTKKRHEKVQKSLKDMKERQEDQISEDEQSEEVMDTDALQDVTLKTSHRVESLIESSPSAYVSSGVWSGIDAIVSMGLSSKYERLRLSSKLRGIRKAAAHYTGLHGFLSGKGHSWGEAVELEDTVIPLNDDEIIQVRRRIAAIENARKKVAAIGATAVRSQLLGNDLARIPRWRRPLARLFRPLINVTYTESVTKTSIETIKTEIDQTQKHRMTMLEIEKVKEIDRLIEDGKRRIYELQCEKDDIQRRPNPLYNYFQGENETNSTAVRKFSFPSEKIVSDYIEDVFSSGRILKMNHTDLWRQEADGFNDEDEGIVNDISSSSKYTRKLNEEKKNINGSVGGSWLLRQSIGAGGSLGEKIGEAVETAAYKSVCTAIMGILARSISALHGMNVMKHADIRIFLENAPDLPSVSKSVLSNDDYVRDAIGKAISKGSKKKRSKKLKAYVYGSGDETFLQRDAVVETLISHCQISAPLLKLFPLSWQRALLGNIISLIAAIVSDFADGVQFQILGHQLSFAFQPITEADIIKHIGLEGLRFNQRMTRTEDFEAAVRATADDISVNLSFLDRWHERVLGGDVLRAQIGNLIARVVLTLVDEVLHSARMDLWCNQANGPRIVAGLEYRNTHPLLDNPNSRPEK